MATRTITELAKAVMDDLGLLEASENPTAAERSYIERRYREGLEELRDDGLVWWDAEAIPYAVFLGVVGFVSVLVSESFGTPRRVPMDVDLEAAKMRIRRRVAKNTSGEQTAYTDF